MRLEAGLVADLVADVSAQPASLPLLQYALTELYDHRDGATMTVAAYEAMGRLAGAMTARAEAVCAAGPVEHSRRLFTRLVTPGEGVEDTRHRARMTELGSGAGVGHRRLRGGSVADVRRRPGDPRADRRGRPRGPAATLAPAALVAGRGPRRAPAPSPPQRRGDGMGGGRTPGRRSLPWRPARIGCHVVPRPTPTASPRWSATYLHEARRRARRGRRLARGAVTAISVLLVIALVAAVLAFVQQRRADDNAAEARSERDARARSYAGRPTRDGSRPSQENVQTEDLALSLLLAREANARSDDPTTRSALQSALLSNGPILGYLRSSPTAQYGSLALGAAGRHAVPLTDRRRTSSRCGIRRRRSSSTSSPSPPPAGWKA